MSSTSFKSARELAQYLKDEARKINELAGGVMAEAEAAVAKEVTALMQCSFATGIDAYGKTFAPRLTGLLWSGPLATRTNATMHRSAHSRRYQGRQVKAGSGRRIRHWGYSGSEPSHLQSTGGLASLAEAEPYPGGVLVHIPKGWARCYVYGTTWPGWRTFLPIESVGPAPVWERIVEQAINAVFERRFANVTNG